MAEIKLKPFVPILFVRNVTASAGFFQDKLGFGIDFLYGEPPFYASVSRGEACLHLRFVHETNFAQLAAREVSLIVASAAVSDLHALFEQFRRRGDCPSPNQTALGWNGFSRA
jgi:hypothetical protein